MQLWEMLKEKLEQLNKTQLVTDVRNWINDLIANIKTKADNNDK